MSAQTIATSTINLPTTFIPTVLNELQESSVIAKLTPARPMPKGAVDVISWSTHPRAEFVGEGEQLNATEAVLKTLHAKPYTAYITVRLSNALLRNHPSASAITASLAHEAATQMAVALDCGALFGVKADGHSTSSVIGTNHVTHGLTAVEGTVNKGTASAKYASALSKAQKDLLKKKVHATAIVVSPLANEDLCAATTVTGAPAFPTMSYDPAHARLKGLPVVVGSALGDLTTPEGLIIGDWANGLAWGLSEDFTVETFRTGDPDGLGDLARKDETAFRFRITYAWATDPSLFAKIAQKEDDSSEAV